MSDYADMADGPIEVPSPQPPYIRYVAWEPAQTGPELVHRETRALRCQIDEMAAAMRKMQESICHLELQVHRLLNPGEES